MRPDVTIAETIGIEALGRLRRQMATSDVITSANDMIHAIDCGIIEFKDIDREYVGTWLTPLREAIAKATGRE